MKRIVSTTLILLFSFAIEAKTINVPNIVTTRSSESILKTNLLNEMRAPQKHIKYDDARRYVLGDIYLDRDENDQIYTEDVYCLQVFHSPQVKKGKIPNNSLLNVEHVWPQSRFTNFERKYQKSDLQHLLPATSKSNSTRGNYSYGEVADHNNPENYVSKKCTASYFDRETKLFEPNDKYKGDIARKKFYFAIRYKGEIPDDEEQVLRKWHKLDPVDDMEREHHERIFKIQGNRNPFIDHPELVDQIEDF